MPVRYLKIAATASAALAGGMLATPASAQSAVDEVGLLNPLVREYRPIGIRVGELTIYPDLDVGLLHDSNIYAEPENEKDDRILYLVPRVTAELQKGTWQFRGLGQLHARRYFKYDSENSTAGILEGDARFSPSEGQTFRGAVSFRRVIEDRGDPEARDIPARCEVNPPPSDCPDLSDGPRRLNVFRGELGYRREVGVWFFGVNGTAAKAEHLAEADVFRDHLSLAGQASVGRRVGGLTFVTVTAFANRRKFDREFDETGFQRDAATFGARAGVQINTGGIFEGGASVGLFRFNADDARIDDYTGVSAAADLIYRPTQRTAILFDAFRGNVATFRGGAVSRTDTRLRASLQQEIRHNFFGRASIFANESKFRGSGVVERTKGVSGELEYLFTRHISVAGGGRYSTRSSDRDEDEFDRFRANLEVRFHL